MLDSLHVGSIHRKPEVDRGYAVNRKMVVLAYTAETVIVVASLIGAFLFSVQYGHHDVGSMVMMMLAPVAYAVVEFCRIPLAISIWTQTSFFLRAIAVIGVLGAGCVTIKSISQLGEIMFRPRLLDVNNARIRQQDAQSALAGVEQKIADANAVVVQRRAELESAERQLHMTTEKLGNLPEQKCLPVSGTGKDGRAWRGMKCSTDQRIAPLTSGIANATRDRQAAADRLDGARASRSALDRTMAEAAVRKTTMAYRSAIMNSQLHSFAAMVFGKEPTEVTEGEVHQFLRVFVFVPAVGSAFAATLVALMAVQRAKPAAVPIELADDAGQYILEPFAEMIMREAAEVATKAARDSVIKVPA